MLSNIFSGIALLLSFVSIYITIKYNKRNEKISMLEQRQNTYKEIKRIIKKYDFFKRELVKDHHAKNFIKDFAKNEMVKRNEIIENAEFLFDEDIYNIINNFSDHYWKLVYILVNQDDIYINSKYEKEILEEYLKKIENEKIIEKMKKQISITKESKANDSKVTWFVDDLKD